VTAVLYVFEAQNLRLYAPLGSGNILFCVNFELIAKEIISSSYRLLITCFIVEGIAYGNHSQSQVDTVCFIFCLSGGAVFFLH